MLGKSFYYNSQSISTIQPDYIVGIQSIKWVNVESSNSKSNVSGYHGVKSSPTYLRGRYITIEGGISADTRAKSVDGINYLRNLFGLRPVAGSNSQYVPFRIIDEQDNERNMQVKVDKPLEIDDGEYDSYDGTVRKWRIVLFADDARMFSTDPNSVEGDEGNVGGWLYGNLFGAWNSVYNEIVCESFGYAESPAIFTITVTGELNEWVKIINTTAGTIFQFTLDEPAVAGDVFVVNALTKRITKNGVNITNKRVAGSIRPVCINTTKFATYDQDGGILVSDCNITIEFYDVII